MHSILLDEDSLQLIMGMVCEFTTGVNAVKDGLLGACCLGTCESSPMTCHCVSGTNTGLGQIMGKT